MMNSVVKISGLHKSFSPPTKALNGIDLSVGQGEMMALIGPSGSGKSTLLRHIAGLTRGDRRADSRVDVFDRNVQLAGRLASGIRTSRANIGYIFQQFNLVNRMSVRGNVLMGLLGRISRVRGSCGWFSKAEQQDAMTALDRVGMAEFAFQRADALSGGQQQRVAIARALVQKAEIILADEPIASLDPESSRVVMDILQSINKEDGKTIIVTLHQVEYARNYCHRVVALRQGKLFFDGDASALTDELLTSIYGHAPGGSRSQHVAHRGDDDKGNGMNTGSEGVDRTGMALAKAG